MVPIAYPAMYNPNVEVNRSLKKSPTSPIHSLGLSKQSVS
jgi:hypothetical protein